MALFRLECGGVKIEIWEVDHGPPHCHISGLDQAGTVVVDLITLRVTRPPGLPLPRQSGAAYGTVRSTCSRPGRG
jgi:hypothetical protein